MSIRSFKMLDWDATFGYAPPTKDVAINTDLIVSAESISAERTRCHAATMRLKLSDGTSFEVIGTPTDLVQP